MINIEGEKNTFPYLEFLDLLARGYKVKKIIYESWPKSHLLGLAKFKVINFSTMSYWLSNGAFFNSYGLY